MHTSQLRFEVMRDRYRTQRDRREDTRNSVGAEEQIRSSGAAADDEAAAPQTRNLLAGAYDIVCRRYFAANEQAARDRTLGLRLILAALAAIAVALLILPFQAS